MSLEEQPKFLKLFLLVNIAPPPPITKMESHSLFSGHKTRVKKKGVKKVLIAFRQILPKASPVACITTQQDYLP